MPAPRQVGQWPTIAERRSVCTLQYGTTVRDSIGGTTNVIWTDFGTWLCKVLTVPDVRNEIDASVTYQVEGPFRQDLWDYANAGTDLRLVVGGLTLKVFKVENPQLRDRTLIAHSGTLLSA